MTLPRAASDESAARAPLRNEAAAAKVLVVDDDEVFRQSTLLKLTSHGYTALEAESAGQARAVLSDEPDIAAVLCDVTMPGESGIELLADLHVEFPELPIVMTTGVRSTEVADTAFQFGAFGYLVKPLDTTELLIGLGGALRRQELERANREHVRALEETVTRTRTLDALLERIPAAGTGTDHFDALIERLAVAISPRDEQNSGHVERMSRCAVILAEAVGLGDRPADEFRLAAALHDVGKIGVADAILLKLGPLSPSECLAMRRHAQIGYQLLANARSDLLRSAADIAWSHHEWWDGSGYPRGLRGDEIPMEAQIVAVVDVFDATTTDRAYRPAMSIDEGIANMRTLRGQQFEPLLVDVFLSHIDEVLAIRDLYPAGKDSDPVRVMVVDDHELFSESLVLLLRGRVEVDVIVTAGNVADAVTTASTHRPDVILMDFELPDGDGVEATEKIKVLAPDTKVIMLTMHTDDRTRARALAAGCSGFVRKDEGVKVLLDTITRVNAGEATVPPSELPVLLSQLEPTHRGLGADITPRELEVLRAMASGRVNKEIAQQLGVRLNTIRNHVQNILYKLEVHSQLEAVATAVREGLVSPSAA